MTGSFRSDVASATDVRRLYAAGHPQVKEKSIFTFRMDRHTLKP
jgi:hypothetical protein